MLEINDWYKFLETCLTQPVTRQRILKYITVSAPDNWQSVHTPFHIVREMCDLIPNENDLGYYVFFSNEFLEVLIHERNIDPKKVLFLPDNELEGKLMKKVYGCNYHVLDKSILQNKTIDLSGIPMKFDKLVVLGNPPYQEMNALDGSDNQNASPLYHLFIDSINTRLNPSYLSFIIPSKWLSGGRGLGEFRENMFKRRQLSVIKHFPGESSVFKDVSIKGGVMYFLQESTFKAELDFIYNDVIKKRVLNQYDIFILDHIGPGILSKVLEKSKSFLSSTCSPQTPFGVLSSFNNFQNKGQKCWMKFSNLQFIPESSYKDPLDLKDKYKLLISKATGLACTPIPIIPSIIALPGEICSQSYLVLKTFNKKKECENFQVYFNTKFLRFILSLRAITQSISRDKFAWVPDMEDYSKVWTDEELYKHFELTQEEIDYIESKIK